MLEDIVEIVARILSSIFKKRPYIAFFILMGLFVIGLGIWILVSQTQEERIFLIIALAFVLFIMAWYTRQVIRRWDIINMPGPTQPEQPPIQQPEMITTDLAAPAVVPAITPSPPIAPAVGAKPSVQAIHLILGAVASVVISAPLVLIASLAIGVSPLVESQEVEGFAIVAGVLVCLLIPIAAGLGALFGGVFTRRAKVRTTARLNWTALLAGGITGFALGLLAMAVFYFLVSTPV